MSGPSADQPSIKPVPTAADVAVVICAYTDERWEDVKAAVASVAEHAPNIGEVVVVIDHNDDLLAKAKETFTGVKVVANRHKKGLSGGRNTGIESTEREIVAFLDDDAYVVEGWADRLVEPYADSNVIGVGGLILPEWQTERPKWWPQEFDWVVGCSYTGQPTSVAPIRNPIGANMSVRREVFAAVGGFSSALGRVGKHPVGGEETELFIRAHEHWPHALAMFQPASAVKHRVPGSRASFSYFRRRCYAEGLSKAVIAKLGDGGRLSSERDYTVKVLPLAVLRGIGQGVRGDVNGFGRAGAVIAGLAITTFGYARGLASKGHERNLTEVPHSQAV